MYTKPINTKIFNILSNMKSTFSDETIQIRLDNLNCHRITITDLYLELHLE